MVESLPYERRVVRRGIAATDGLTSFELSYEEIAGGPSVFEDCYTVLRPTYDRALGELARQAGISEADLETLVWKNPCSFFGRHGRGSEEDLDTLVDVTTKMTGTTICVLSDSVAAPVQSSINKFRDDYLALIRRGERVGAA